MVQRGTAVAKRALDTLGRVVEFRAASRRTGTTKSEQTHKARLKLAEDTHTPCGVVWSLCPHSVA